MVAVGIIEYNRPEFTSTAIHSAHDNAGIEHEIILVVNSPLTEHRIDKKAKRLARQPIIVNKTNLGYTKAANQIINAAGIKDVVLLNSDTMCSPDWLKHLKDAAYYKCEHKIGMAMPRLTEKYGLHKGAYCAHKGSGCMKSKQDPTLGRGWFGFACAYLRRDMIADIGLMDEKFLNYGSDREYGQRAASLGYWYAHTHMSLVRHICQGSQIRTRNWS